MIDVSELMDDEDFETTFSIIRERGAFDEGRWVPTTVQLDGISGIVQPAQASELEFMPEGQRTGDWISIWCSQEIRMGDGVTLMPDVILYKGARYRVHKAISRPENGFYRAWAQGFAHG